MSVAKVSIVITNYNYARFLERAVDSALAQTYPEVEVIVVDDASQDNSRDIIAGFGSRIVPLLQPENGGQGAAFNAGFEACHGDIVFFLDADDYLYPHAVASVVARMAKGVVQAQFRLDLIDSGGRKIDTIPATEIYFDVGDVVPKLVTRGRYECTVTSGNAFARQALRSIAPIPREKFRISADGYLVTLAPLYGMVVALDEPLGAYTLHGGNNWAGGSENLAAQAARLRRSLLHDLDRYEALREKTRELGITMVSQPGLHDPVHLSARLGSLVLDPELHPLKDDKRLGLAFYGARASFKANLRWMNRLILAMWFLAAGVLPRSWAQKAVIWRLFPPSRPAGLQYTLSRIKSALRRLHFRHEA